MNSSKNIAKAERKVAAGIAQLYDVYKPDPTGYDQQGIAIVFVPPQQLLAEIKANLPNQGQNGLTLFYYASGYQKQPPIRYMLEQKIKSLVSAARKLYPQADEKIKAVEEKLLQEINLDSMTAENFHERSKQLMQQYTEKACFELYHAIFPNTIKKVDMTKFVKNLIKQSTHTRSNTTDVVTFDEEANKFSFDVLMSPVTAHDRGVNKDVANLSLVFEGSYADGVAQVSSSLVKHAALPPIDEISGTRLSDLYETDIDVLVATCNHIEQVAQAMATLQRHGGGNNKAVDIDWTYQLLTTNAFNVEKQASTYGFTVNAMLLMNAVSLPNNVNLTMHVFNAGINKLANWNLGQKSDTQRRENRKAYLHLTKAFEELMLPSMVSSTALSDRFHDVKDAFAYLQLQPNELLKQQEVLMNQLAENAHEFNKLRQKYNSQLPAARHALKVQMKICLDKAKKLNVGLNRVNGKIEREQKALWQQNREKITEVLGALRVDDRVARLNNDLSIGGRAAARAAAIIIKLSAVYYKAQMDELYYTGAYRDPEKAALFNALMSAYQHAMGLMASTGCKSANDRTYVARLMLAALEGRDLKDKPVPSDLLHTPDALVALKENLDKIAMSNTAMHSAISDTGGGTPKADAKKFHILAAVQNIECVSKFGKYAAHKLKSSNMVKKIVAAIKKLMAPKASQTGLFATRGKDKKAAQAPAARPRRKAKGGGIEG